MAEQLSEDEIREELEDMQIWGIEFGKLSTEVEFENYKEAVFFANQVFSIAEKEFHHPEVTVEYGTVKIDLWSHDVEGITERDIEMAREIEETLSETKWS